MKPSFVNGPWAYERDTMEPYVVSGSVRIATCEGRGRESIANAHLIAAAPEMYDMLAECMCALANPDFSGEHRTRLINYIQDTLKKARGEQ